MLIMNVNYVHHFNTFDKVNAIGIICRDCENGDGVGISKLTGVSTVQSCKYSTPVLLHADIGQNMGGAYSWDCDIST